MAEVIKGITWVLITLLAPVAFAAHDVSPKRVFVLYDQNRDFAGLALLDQTLTATLKARAEGRLEIYTEFMDASRFRDGNEQDYEETLKHFYRRKYAGKKIDLIVAVFGPSLEFLLKHGSALFPGVPIVFCGIDQREVESLSLGPGVTGVLVKREFRPTLDLALRLHPDTRQVFFVAGTSRFNKYWTERARRELQEPQAPVKINYLTDLSMPALQTELGRLPHHSIVFYLHLFTDGAGKSFNPYDALSLIARNANAPIYTVLDTYVGLGVVGGFVFSLEAHAIKAAELGLRILQGEIPADIPIAEIRTNVNMFDWRQLRRWDIAENRLPPGSVIRFRELSFWDLYLWHVTGAVLLIAAQSALIFTLLVQRRRRHVAELELQKRRQEMAHLTRLSTMGELAGSLAHELNQPLTAILSNAQAAQRFLAVQPADVEEVREVLKDIVRDNHRASEVIRGLRDLVKKGDLDVAALDLAAIVDDVVLLVRSDAILHNVSISLDIDSGMPKVQGDKVQLQQVMLNLLLNAFQAMKDCSAKDREVTVRTAFDGAGMVIVTVRDTGTGLRADEVGKIFQPFYTTKTEGLGMGLAISRSIIEAHGGRLWAVNNLERGATFHFTLPISSPQ